MRYRISLIVLAAGLTGCGVVFNPIVIGKVDVTQRHDISTGNDTVEIRGSKKGVLERETCHIVRPTSTMVLVTDSGPVSIVVGCFVTVQVVVGRYGFNFAAVDFVAKAGHTYRFGRTSNHVSGFPGIDLIDITDSKRLVVRRPFSSAEPAGASSLAYIFAAWHTAGAGSRGCELDGLPNFQFINTGDLNFSVRCREWSSSFGPLKSKITAEYVADINFKAEPGHIYAVSIANEGGKCVQLADVTTEPLRSLSCQPTTDVVEDLGKTRVEICAGPKTKCREMTSCAEAKRYMKCGLIGLDGDFDGVPCDSICK